MLRIFAQYYPIRNVFFVIGEGFFIFASIFLATWIMLVSGAFIYDLYIWLKILLITFVCQACLYYNDMYDFKISENYKEIGLRLIQTLGFSAIFLAIVYFVVPQAIIGTGIFLIVAKNERFILLLIFRAKKKYLSLLESEILLPARDTLPLLL